MAAPAFLQRDQLLAGEVIPDVPGLVGWANDATDNGVAGGMEWKFYGPNDTVTLHAVTEGYEQYSWDIQTILAGHADDSLIELQNNYYYRFDFFDNPETGLDNIVAAGQRHRAVSWWGDVDLYEGHRHSGDRYGESYDYTLAEGPDYLIECEDGGLDENAQGDGIGVSLGFREFNRNQGPADASLFFKNVYFGGDVFADPDTIK
jgi:hypothetical protein